MKKKIIIGVIILLIASVPSYFGYKQYSKDKWIKENWNVEHAISRIDDFDTIKSWLEYRESIGAITSKDTLDAALSAHIDKYEILELLISKGADPNYCYKDRCTIPYFLRYESDKIPDSLRILKLIVTKGGILKPTPQNSVRDIEDCTFEGAMATDEIFDFIFNDYLKNRLSAQILECSSKNIVLSAGYREDNKMSERLLWLIKNGLNPNVEVYGIIIIQDVVQHAKLPILYHVLNHHRFNKSESSRDKSQLLINELISKGANLKKQIPELSLAKLAEESGDTKLFQLINSKVKE